MRIPVAAGAAVIALACALPAHAGDEFEDGFKDELGRIAAHQAVSGARQLLVTLLTADWHAAPARAPDPPEHRPRTRRRYERDHGDGHDRLHDPTIGHYDHSHAPFGYHCHP